MVFIFFLLLIFSHELTAQDSLRVEDLLVLKGTPLEQEYREMLFNHQLHQAEEATQRRLARLGSLRSQTDFLSWQEETRKKFLELIGGLPRTKTPLNTRVVGQNLARYLIWDGVRALDYLTSLPEVDSSRIGATGNSGGRTLTTYISMLDPRVKAASIVTYITSIPKKIEARIDDAESDPEQDVYGLLAAGIDHTELVGAFPPRPVLIGAALRYFFPSDGTQKTFLELHPRDGMDATLAYAAFFLGQTLLGMRVWDALNVVEFLHSRPDVDPQRINIIGRGWAGTTALFAAALDRRIARITVEGVPASYTDMARSEDSAQPVSLMLPGVLEDFDLQDIFAAVAPRPQLVLNPLRASTERMVQEEARQTMEPVSRAYRAGQAPDALEVRVVPLESDIMETIPAWSQRE